MGIRHRQFHGGVWHLLTHTVNDKPTTRVGMLEQGEHELGIASEGGETIVVIEGRLNMKGYPHSPLESCTFQPGQRIEVDAETFTVYYQKPAD